MKWLERAIDRFICYIRDSGGTPIYIGDEGNPTYWRWFVIPRNRFLNLYLHHFLKDDEHDLYDHRAANISIILQGEYAEERFGWKPCIGCPLPTTRQYRIRRWCPLFRLPSTPHRVVLPRDTREGRPVPCWSLFIKFPDVRDWGFYCGGRDGMSTFWRPWQEYAASRDPNNVGYGIKGKGCDE